MDFQKGLPGSSFAEFCNFRLREYLRIRGIPLSSRMLILGVCDEGQDAYYFAKQGYHVVAIDSAHQPDNYMFENSVARFLTRNLTTYLRSSDAHQGRFFAIYCRTPKSLSPNLREDVLCASFYLLGHGGWLMLELDHADMPLPELIKYWRFLPVYIGDHAGFSQAILQKLS
jgi:hypothetical protein